MQVELVTIDTLQQTLDRLDKQSFSRQYPGAFLLAMGYLAVDAIKSGRRTAEAVKREGRVETAAVTFGARLRHDGAEPHPLAGCAFFVRPTEASAQLTIGRSTDCHITIPDASVSEWHCRIDVTAEGVFVTDMDSTNGTTVNLERLEHREERLLADEDILSVGRYSFQMLSAATLYEELALLRAMEDDDLDL